VTTRTLLWVDDDIRALSGLEAYLHEIGTEADSEDGALRLRKVFTFDQAQVELDQGGQIDLLLFDMVLMEDPEHAALDRLMGIHVARRAVGKKVRRFVCYTVLSRSEVMSAWKKLEFEESQREGNWNGVEFEYFAKNDATVKEIKVTVARMLKSLKEA